MHKFLNLEPPEKKSKSREETLEYQRGYDKNKRSRTFSPKWQERRHWLIYKKGDIIANDGKFI